MHAGERFQVVFDSQAISSVDIRRDPATADIKLFGADFEAGPEGVLRGVAIGGFE
ncbi:MAG: hypothetical protein RL215_2575 [Planctomycetota bacterium]